MDIRSDPNGPDLDEVLRLAREARNNVQLRDDPVWAYREALVHVQRANWEGAVGAIADAIKLDARDLNLRREQENILVLAGRHQDVLSMTEAMARDGRAPYWVYLNRGRARHGLKDDAGAAAEFNAGLTAAADNSAAVEQIVKAMVATVGKDEALGQVLARADKDVRWKLLAAALYSVPDKDKGRPADWERAVAMLDEVQAHFSELSPAHKAQALRIAGPLYQLAQPPQYDKAKAAYEQLLTVAKDDLFALNNLANLLIDESLVPQPQEARKYSQAAYDQVRRAQPFPAAIFDTHGWVLVQCGELTEAIEILQKVTSQSSMPEAHYHLGEAYLRKQDYNKAKEQLRIASQAIGDTISQGGSVPPGLEKKIQAAMQKAGEVERAARGGEAVAR
jgi:tetratricopeptide (TPR) repeat protein